MQSRNAIKSSVYPEIWNLCWGCHDGDKSLEFTCDIQFWFVLRSLGFEFWPGHDWLPLHPFYKNITGQLLCRLRNSKDFIKQKPAAHDINSGMYKFYFYFLLLWFVLMLLLLCSSNYIEGDLIGLLLFIF
jgi:hypothetical protein